MGSAGQAASKQRLHFAVAVVVFLGCGKLPHVETCQPRAPLGLEPTQVAWNGGLHHSVHQASAGIIVDHQPPVRQLREFRVTPANSKGRRPYPGLNGLGS